MDMFTQRRQQLLRQMAPMSVAVIPAAKERVRSRDTEFKFRQDSDFFYLTGFNEAEALLVLSTDPSKPSSTLFCAPKDKQAEIWHGRRLGPVLAEQQLAVDQALSLELLDDAFPELIAGHAHLYFQINHCEQAEQRVFATLDQLKRSKATAGQAPASIHDISGLLHEMRLIKSDDEIALMKQAADISVDAHIRAMQFARPGCFEYQLEAEILHQFMTHGASAPAYNSIVGAGANGCILHYTDNRDVVAEDDLILIDAGAEYKGYAADITRTFPSSGVFSEPQKALYQVVLSAQLAALDALKPGATLTTANNAAIRVITQGLLDLGILQGELDDNIERMTYRQFYMHGLSHWLGLDVHDVGSYQQDGEARPLQPGMVLTVEPGIYIDADADVETKWQNIGIRIEDDIVITPDGHLNLTARAPKTVAEIEALMSK